MIEETLYPVYYTDERKTSECPSSVNPTYTILLLILEPVKGEESYQDPLKYYYY